MGSAGKDAVLAAQTKANEQVTDYQNQQEKAKKSVEKQKQAYRNIEFTNPYTIPFCTYCSIF